MEEGDAEADTKSNGSGKKRKATSQSDSNTCKDYESLLLQHNLNDKQEMAAAGIHIVSVAVSCRGKGGSKLTTKRLSSSSSSKPPSSKPRLSLRLMSRPQCRHDGRMLLQTAPP